MLLATKMFVPRPPPRAVRRVRLFEQLDEAQDSALTLISAPAGFGKTALVGEWIRERGVTAAWLTLDALDDDPGQFWRYLIEVLRAVDERVGETGHELLRAPQSSVGDAVAATIINDLAASSKEFVCVLDDYHVIATEEIHRGLVLLVDRMPPNARLIVTTRADPPWPLARFRATGRMAELRVADLRFTDAEARLLLEAAGLPLEADDLGLLESRTEGWIAGLQMAVLSMRHREDPSQFIHDFAGSHRFVLDYLTQEVLARQPEETRDFLVRTSILGRLTGSLCDAVTGQDDGHRVLEDLEQSNLFTEPLDDEREWYRYHQLFAEVLRSDLSEYEPDLRAELNNRASRWFESEGFSSEAVHHALEAGNGERAAGLIVQIASATFMVSNQILILQWLNRLPSDVIAATPALALVNTWARFVTGDWEGMVPALEVAAKSIGSMEPTDDRDALLAQLDGIRAWLAYQTGDLNGCVALASAALERMPPDSLVPRRIVASAHAYGLLLLGDAEAATGAAVEAVVESRHVRDPLTECLALGVEAQANLLDGQLRRAARAYQRAITVGTIGGELLPSASIAQIQYAELMREKNHLGDAESVLRNAIHACEAALGLPEWVFEGNVTLARVLAAKGDLASARQALDAAEDLLLGDLIPGGMVPIVARALGYRTRYWLATGDIERAEAWLAEQGVFDEARPPHAARMSSVLLARALIARGEHVRALGLVDRLFSTMDPSAGVGQRVELRCVQARLFSEVGRDGDAIDAAAEALRLAESNGYFRIFIDEGVPMIHIVEEAAAAHPSLAGYVGRVVDAAGRTGNYPAEAMGLDANGALREPLSDRELEILRLLAAGHSNQEIAGGLYLSVNTVKWHARNLYGKLGVNRRTLAVARARELDIL